MKCLEIFARRIVLDEFDHYGDELTPRFQPAGSRPDGVKPTTVPNWKVDVTNKPKGTVTQSTQ